MSKKKFSETKLGQFLKKVGSTLVDKAEHILPESGFYGILKNLIVTEKQLTPEDKQTAIKLLAMDMVEMQEVSKRWACDMKSESWLSENTRPMTLIFLAI